MDPPRMQADSKEKLQEMQNIISKMPLHICWSLVLPEFGVRWRDVAKAVRSNRLHMIPSSVARVLCRHAAKSLPDWEIAEILARLQLKLIATQERKWHVIELHEPIEEQMPIEHIIEVLPSRVAQALKRSRAGKTMTPEVQAVLLNDLIYMSVQMVRGPKSGPALYLAAPPGQHLVLVSAVNSSLLKGCVEGLGYKKYEDAQLFGKDIPSLLQIHNRNHNEIVDHLAELPEYNPQPVITANSIDFTYQEYNENYVDEVLGPNPPLLTELTISTSKPFYDPSRLKKNINLTISLKSDNVAQSLKSWVKIRAIHPMSDFFKIFHQVKSNKIAFQNDDDDENDMNE